MGSSCGLMGWEHHAAYTGLTREIPQACTCPLTAACSEPPGSKPAHAGQDQPSWGTGTRKNHSSVHSTPRRPELEAEMSRPQVCLPEPAGWGAGMGVGRGDTDVTEYRELKARSRGAIIYILILQDEA